ncbi:DNA-processing protein DprA [Dermacoccaceae bacterium W4C1]
MTDLRLVTDRQVPPEEGERGARVALARLTEPGSATVRAEVMAHGYPGAMQRLRNGVGPLAGAAAARLANLDLAAEERAVGLCRARLIFPGDAEWPSGVNELECPPHCLWVRGPADLAAISSGAVAVVGARSASAYGTQVATELGHDLARRGVSVVSGAAYGIDAAAHRGALAADGITVAALACGIDRAYPAAHAELLRQIAATGAVLSEVPPGSAPLRSRFLARNRLIAALGMGTIVVEAGLRSGSLNTAGWAESLGRPVGAVPGPISSPASAGTNQALRQRSAEVVTSAEEVMELVGRFGLDLAPVLRARDLPQDRLDPAEFAVWEVLSARRARTIDELAAAAGATVGSVEVALAGLEVSGLAEPSDHGWRRLEG